MNKIAGTAVLLTCHNRKEKTIACLVALYNCFLPDKYYIDVYLVDDGSTDGTGEAVKNQFPNINLIQGDGNLYWNRGMHLAWSTAASVKDYDYYLWLNDDTIMFEDALKILLQKAETIGGNHILVGATCSVSLKEITYGGFQFYDNKLIPNGVWQVCDYFNGNIVLVPSSVFKKNGFLDFNFRHALGDFDYGMRATKMGFKHFLAPKPLGKCEKHIVDPTWRNSNASLYKRLRHLYNPLGNNPIEFFIIDRRQYGLTIAVFHFFSIHLRSFFPNLWR